MRRTLTRPNGRFSHIGLSAITILFGMQTLRTLLPLLVYVLRDRFGWTAIQVGLAALAIFLTSFLAAPVQRRLGPRRALRWVLGGLGLLRLAYQLWWGDPLVDLYLVSAATILFLWAIPLLLGYTRSGGLAETGMSALGLLLGLLLDTAVHGLYLTYDMGWHQDWISAAFTLLLVLMQWSFLGELLAQPTANRSAANDTLFPLAFVLMGIGPFLFLQLVVLQNVARLTVLTGWQPALVLGWILLSQLLGLVTAVLLYILHHPKIWIVAALFGLALLGSLLAGWPPGWLAALFLLVAHVSSAGLLMFIFEGLGAGVGHAGLARMTIGHGLGIILMMLFTFVFYSSYDLPIPFANVILLPIAGLVVGLAGIGAARQLSDAKPVSARPPRRLALIVLILLLPLYQYVTRPEIMATSASGATVRVMTYNLHNGFDPQGYLGMEAIAQVIEAQQPDVIALQEVSRGWATNGSLDMVAWLSRRLGMPYVFGPTADPIWGNALLSRYPIVTSELVKLPTDDLPLKRSFIFAQIETEAGQPLNVIATHFHHPDNGSPIRINQAETILDYWAVNGRTLIMGDLNAEPGTPEIEMLRQAGLIDAADAANTSPAYTYPATAPSEHIDYIWLSPDLTATDFVIPPQPASDHLATAVTIGQ